MPLWRRQGKKYENQEYESCIPLFWSTSLVEFWFYHLTRKRFCWTKILNNCLQALWILLSFILLLYISLFSATNFCGLDKFALAFRQIHVRRMKTSPVFPGNEAGSYFGYEFDPHADFAQFLQEARKRTCDEGNFKAAPRHSEETRKTQSNGEKRNKKSWKSSLFSWLKSDKKSKNLVEPLHGSATPKLSRGIVSGPTHGSAGGLIPARPRKPISGPLTSLFNPAKKEDEIPYISLSHLTNPHEAQSYGPVYLVT